MTLFKKVVLFALLMILPLNLVALFVTRKAIETTIEQIAVTDHQFATSFVENLGRRMDSAVSMLYFFATENVDCIQTMRQRDTASFISSKLRFFVSLKNLAYMTDGADGYFYYFEKKQDSLFYSADSVTESFKSTSLPEAISNLPRQRWTISTIEDISYLILVLESNSTVYGAWIDLDRIRGDLFSGLNYETTEVIFSQKQAQELHDDYIGSAATNHGITITITQERTEVLRNISPEVRFLYGTAIIYLIATPLLWAFIYHFFLNPLKTVTKANREIQSGNLDYRIQDKGKSPEYDEVFRSFNAMAEDLKRTKNEVFEKEIEKHKVELRNLQLQIRPHFLLNTFNLIYTLVQNRQNEQIEETVLYLTDYFRFLFRSSNETELFEKELEVIRGYLRVSNIRYRGQIESVIDIAPEVEKVAMPPLLIHNFIENTIKHGIRQGYILHVWLSGTYENGIVKFCIEDDGNGMDVQTLERIRNIFNGNMNLDKKNEHIGLYNSYKRLKLVLGEEMTIDVDSEPRIKTSFTIQFPYRIGEQNEAADCK